MSVKITLTGPAGSGKTTLANIIEKLLNEHGIVTHGRDLNDHVLIVDAGAKELVGAASASRSFPSTKANDLIVALAGAKLEAEAKVEKVTALLKIQSQLSDDEVTIRELKRLLRSIINDAQAMRYSLKATELEEDEFDSGQWFGSFGDAIDALGDRDSDTKIEWPNLSISVGEAEAYLKELEAK